MYDSRFSIAQAAERLHRKYETRDRIRAQRRENAQMWAREVAQILAQSDNSLQKVIGFGSTFETWRTFREDSDIDLGIIGGNWSLLMRSVPASEFDVSLVELELQNAEFRDYVLNKGEVLYARR
jgi:predicted nucleotidyltransferase